MQLLFPLKLYTTSYCHLCEEAYALLSQLGLANQLTIIDIADNEQLRTRYETRIPVLQRSDNAAELNWLFTEKEITTFIK